MLASHASVVEPIAAALDVFNELRDAEDFVDTLQRISACRDEIDIPTIHSAVEDEPTEAEVRLLRHRHHSVVVVVAPTRWLLKL